MCGLFGVYRAGGLDKTGLDIFNRLGKLSESRGVDSTGIASVERAVVKKNKAFITRHRKGLGRASKFLATTGARYLTEASPLLLAGHTRMATHGSVNLHNAHPFEIGHLVGMHNGVYSGLYDRANDKTDSRVIFEMLNTMGVPRGLRTINEKHLGYMALSFINKSSDTFNLFTNGGRSLFLGKTGDTWCWASEERFLKAAASKWAYLGEVPDDTLVSLRLGTEKWKITQFTYNRASTSSKKDEDAREGFDEIPFNTGSAVDYTRESCSLPPSKAPVSAKAPEILPPPQSTLRYRTTPGCYLTRPALYDLTTNHGCSVCLTKTKSLLRTPLFFFTPSRYICEDCRSTDSMIETFFNDTELHQGAWVLPSGKEITFNKQE